ncbi:MAG: PTS sugar transporter subunit IIA [Planctomycetota bacterium]|nr:PTS sugar transporter subunit IIA [Planctomycetota bacterium]
MNDSQKMKIASASARTNCGDYHATLSQIALRAHQTILPKFDHPALTEALNNRELLSFTSTPEGVAFPHAIHDEINPSASGIVIMTLFQPILWGSNQVQIVVGLFGSTSEPWRHVRSLARIARVCSQANIRQELIACGDDLSLLNLFDKECNNNA